ncbi:GNAT family N-acetyltransferase [Actinomadura sp. 9N407]|uniref:GNAT family N-acetyltransferase n=1 Tax=Actinomadura sp. 9N407 TaxID=3375154 RepID=UPI0037B18CDB
MKQLEGADGVPAEALPAEILHTESLPAEILLSDVRIRPYAIDDGDRLRRMSGGLSRKSLYTRFFSGTPRIPEAYVTALRMLDHWDREAMVALLDGEMIGVAEYIRDRHRPWRAELAVLIADPWQRRGLARRLVTCLAPLAERRGITGFDAEVILENRDAMVAIRHGWPAARPGSQDGAAHYSLPLPLPTPAVPAPARALG